MYVAKGNSFLPDFSLKNLENKYAQEANAKAKTRLQCAVLRKKGKSMPFIAEVTSKRESTVSDILRRFEERGITGCYAVKQKGQPPKLTNIERLKLKKALNKSPQECGLPFVIWTTKLVAYFIKHAYKKELVNRQVQRVIKSFNMSIQKQRPEHIKANKKLQAQFKKNFDEGLRNLCRQDMRSPFWTRASLP
ncbi:MAG: winged helix-turn-helix domain-containing protein [Candidatus Brocadiales bacterium]|nr:winged helix-turn-helix domain-containing protein [Candidatus Brocadiales bacterium]